MQVLFTCKFKFPLLYLCITWHTVFDDVLQHLWKVFLFITAAGIFSFVRGLECVVMEREVSISGLIVAGRFCSPPCRGCACWETSFWTAGTVLCVEAQMASDWVSAFKWGIIRHFRLLMLLEDWPDFQKHQAINSSLLISVGTRQPSMHQKNWAGYLETCIWFSNLYSGECFILFLVLFFLMLELASVFLCCIWSSYAFAYSANSGFFGTLGPGNPVD